MNKLFVSGLLLSFSLSASSQILRPIKWSYAAKKTSATEATILIKATLEKGWHLYAQSLAEGRGPVKTSFTFNPSPTVQLIGKVSEPNPIVKFEKVFNMNVSYFEDAVIFQQKVKLSGKNVLVKGNVEFMICSDKQCLPPETKEFSIPIG